MDRLGASASTAVPLSPPLPVPGAGCCGAARMTMPRSTATPAEASREVAARAAPSLFDEGTWPLLRNVLFTLTVLTVVLGAGLVAWGSATGSTLDTLFPNDRFDYVQWTAAFAFVLFVLRTLNHLSGCIGEADVFIFRVHLVLFFVSIPSLVHYGIVAFLPVHAAPFYGALTDYSNDPHVAISTQYPLTGIFIVQYLIVISFLCRVSLRRLLGTVFLGVVGSVTLSITYLSGNPRSTNLTLGVITEATFVPMILSLIFFEGVPSPFAASSSSSRHWWTLSAAAAPKAVFVVRLVAMNFLRLVWQRPVNADTSETFKSISGDALVDLLAQITIDAFFQRVLFVAYSKAIAEQVADTKRRMVVGRVRFIGHEIRNPLQSVIFSIEELRHLMRLREKMARLVEQRALPDVNTRIEDAVEEDFEGEQVQEESFILNPMPTTTSHHPSVTASRSRTPGSASRADSAVASTNTPVPSAWLSADQDQPVSAIHLEMPNSVHMLPFTGRADSTSRRAPAAFDHLGYTHAAEMADRVVRLDRRILRSVGTILPSLGASAEAMRIVLDDILSLQKIEEGVLSIVRQPFRPRQVVQSIADSLQPQAAPANLSLHVRCDVDDGFLLGDANRIGQIVRNFGSNALKFARSFSLPTPTEIWHHPDFIADDDRSIHITDSFEKIAQDDDNNAETPRTSSVDGGAGIGDGRTAVTTAPHLSAAPAASAASHYRVPSGPLPPASHSVSTQARTHAPPHRFQITFGISARPPLLTESGELAFSPALYHFPGTRPATAPSSSTSSSPTAPPVPSQSSPPPTTFASPPSSFPPSSTTSPDAPHRSVPSGPPHHAPPAMLSATAHPLLPDAVRSTVQGLPSTALPAPSPGSGVSEAVGVHESSMTPSGSSAETRVLSGANGAVSGTENAPASDRGTVEPLSTTGGPATTGGPSEMAAAPTRTVILGDAAGSVHQSDLQGTVGVFGVGFEPAPVPSSFDGTIVAIQVSPATGHARSAPLSSPPLGSSDGAVPASNSSLVPLSAASAASVGPSSPGRSGPSSGSSSSSSSPPVTSTTAMGPVDSPCCCHAPWQSSSSSSSSSSPPAAVAPSLVADDSESWSPALEALARQIQPHPNQTQVHLPHLLEESEQTRAVCFWVHDHGCGITPEHFERIFRPFQQIDAAALQGGQGHGLGLAICLALADLQRGVIGFQSIPNVGTVFYLWLRLGVAEPDWATRGIGAPTGAPVSLGGARTNAGGVGGVGGGEAGGAGGAAASAAITSITGTNGRIPSRSAMKPTVEADASTSVLRGNGQPLPFHPVLHMEPPPWATSTHTVSAARPGHRAGIAASLVDHAIADKDGSPSDEHMDGPAIVIRGSSAPSVTHGSERPSAPVAPSGHAGHGATAHGATAHGATAHGATAHGATSHRVRSRAPHPHVRHSLRGRVLVVDDAPDIRIALHRLIAQAGFQVDGAVDGMDALVKLRAGLHDAHGPWTLVVMDREMHPMGGIECLRQMRRDAALSHIPVLGLSGEAAEDAMQEFRDAGANLVRTKPINPTDLLEILNQAAAAAAPAPAPAPDPEQGEAT